MKIFFIILTLYCQSSFAQFETGLNIDSLKQRLLNARVDTSTARTYIRLGQQFENSHPDSAIYFYKKAGAISETLNDANGIIRSINNYTAVLNMLGKFDTALQETLRAVSIAKKERLDEPLMMAQINTAAVYQQMEKYPEALNWYLQAQSRMEKNAEPARLAIYYGNLCGLYRNLRQDGKALEFARKALPNAEQSRNPALISGACNNLANALKDRNQISEAITLLERALAIAVDEELMVSEETALINLADCYLQLEQPRKYMPLYERAHKLAQELGDISGDCFSRLGIAFGHYWTKNYGVAKKELEESIAYARQYHQQEPLARMLLLMSDLQIVMGTPELSKPFRAEYDSVKAQLTGIDLQKNIQELETKYGTAIKEKQLLEQRQLLLIAISVVSILILLLISGILVYRQRQKLNRKAMEAATAEKEAVRLKAALEGEQMERNRISSEMHDDMGSGLTKMLFLSRRLQTGDENAAKISDTAKGLVTRMNEIIWMMSERDVTLANMLNHSNKTANDLLDAAGIGYEYALLSPVPDLMLSQELRRDVFLVIKEGIHNAIKHSGATKVLMTVDCRHELMVTISDNGKGMGGEKANHDTNTNHSGQGMKNMRERISKHNGSIRISENNGNNQSSDNNSATQHNENNAAFPITDNNGTTLVITVPLPS